MPHLINYLNFRIKKADSAFSLIGSGHTGTVRMAYIVRDQKFYFNQKNETPT